jgi:hypothetical protein
MESCQTYYIVHGLYSSYTTALCYRGRPRSTDTGNWLAARRNIWRHRKEGKSPWLALLSGQWTVSCLRFEVLIAVTLKLWRHVRTNILEKPAVFIFGLEEAFKYPEDGDSTFPPTHWFLYTKLFLFVTYFRIQVRSLKLHVKFFHCCYSQYSD